MKGQYFVVSCFAEAQQTARNDHEHKQQSGDDNGSEFDASELNASVQVANGHPCNNPHRKRGKFMDSGVRPREWLPGGPWVV